MLLIFSNPHFRLMWITFTLMGFSGIMFMMVHGWLTLSITGSPFWVGSVAGAGGLGFMGFSIVGGVLAFAVDRLWKRARSA